MQDVEIMTKLYNEYLIRTNTYFENAIPLKKFLEDSTCIIAPVKSKNVQSAYNEGKFGGLAISQSSLKITKEQIESPYGCFLSLRENKIGTIPRIIKMAGIESDNSGKHTFIFDKMYELNSPLHCGVVQSRTYCTLLNIFTAIFENKPVAIRPHSTKFPHIK